MGDIVILPRLFCPAMPKIQLMKAPRWDPPDPGTPEYEANVERIKREVRDERLANNLCVEHGLPLDEGSCRICTARTLGTFDRVIAHLTGGAA